jgi:hypothetical protein
MNNNMNQNYNQQSMMQPVQPIMQPQKTNALCIVSLILAFILGPVGTILGIVGLINAKKHGEKGKGFAIAAIIIGILIPLLIILLFVALFAGIIGIVNGESEAAIALQEGCAKLDNNGDYESSDGTVICENYKCEYSKDGFKLSSTCNLVNTENYEDEEDDDDYIIDTTPGENTEEPTTANCEVFVPNYNIEGPFLMYIEDVFTIAGKGTTVVGIIQRGSININDNVEILGLNTEKRTTKVTGIEVLNVAKNNAIAGEQVTLLLEGVARTDIERGQTVSAINSIQTHTEIEIDACIFTKDDGGRHTPFFANYRPQIKIGTTTVTGVITLPEGVEMVMPGDKLKLTITLEESLTLEEDSFVTIMEGGRKIGTGKVTKIIK